MLSKRTNFIILILFLQVKLIFAQTSIQGKLVDEENTTIVGASVLLITEQDSAITAFAISDSEGAFKILIPSNYETKDSLLLSIRSIGYKNWYSKVDKIDFGTITLASSSTLLKEVNVKASPINQSGDTVIYTVQSFAETQDRSLDDVLKNMPGIEVGANGVIQYEGQPIQKFYIEGLDPLEGKYSLATKNIPHDKVASVEVLENHQPIKMLDGKIPSFLPSINIVLKQETTLTGVADVGFGIPDLADLNVSPMLFNKKLQYIGSVQFTNTGKNIDNQLNTLTAQNIQYINFQEKPEPTLGFSSLLPSYFSEEIRTPYLQERSSASHL